MSRQVVIVGGGITGLSAAHALVNLRPDVGLTLLEARERVGGNIVTERADGFLLDGGPDSFLRTKPQAAALCKELGLGEDLITTREQARKVYMVHEGALEPMPAGMALAVPTRLGPMLETPLLSFPGKLRMLGDLLLPARRAQADESIEEFVARRFGREAAISLAAPLLGGIYAGDIGALSVKATFPQLVELEQQHGSLVVGLFSAARRARGEHANGGRLRGAMQALGWMRRSGEPPPSPFLSLRGGMGDLVSALSARLPSDSVRVNTAVARVLRRDDGRWQVALERGEPLIADAVLIAAPAHAAARMVPDAALASELAAIPYLSTATVFFGWPRELVSHPLDGVGFIAPKGQTALIAATWVTSKWDERAPAGHVLVRAFVGGVRSAIDVARGSDQDLAAAALAELERLMGPLGRPELTRVFRYVDSNPQPLVGHPERLTRIAQQLERLPGLYVAGAAYDGVGIPDCVRQGRSAAARILTDRC
jgi:protoporphyrinogen/coproporphyrinogen III oxidase